MNCFFIALTVVLCNGTMHGMVKSAAQKTPLSELEQALVAACQTNQPEDGRDVFKQRG